jgi:transposase
VTAAVRRRPPTGRPIEETIEDYLWMRREGLSLADIAQRLGIGKESLRRQLQRARRKGLL